MIIEPNIYIDGLDIDEIKKQERRFAEESRLYDSTKTVKKEIEAINFVEDLIAKKSPSYYQTPQPLPNSMGTTYSDWLDKKETKSKLNKAKVCLNMRIESAKQLDKKKKK